MLHRLKLDLYGFRVPVDNKFPIRRRFAHMCQITGHNRAKIVIKLISKQNIVNTFNLHWHRYTKTSQKWTNDKLLNKRNVTGTGTRCTLGWWWYWNDELEHTRRDVFFDRHRLVITNRPHYCTVINVDNILELYRKIRSLTTNERTKLAFSQLIRFYCFDGGNRG